MDLFRNLVLGAVIIVLGVGGCSDNGGSAAGTTDSSSASPWGLDDGTETAVGQTDSTAQTNPVDTADTSGVGDTADTSGVGDTADTSGVGDTAETADSSSGGDTSDTNDTGHNDTDSTVTSDTGSGANGVRQEPADGWTIYLDPHTRRAIGGISTLNRDKYFNISHSGTYFEAKFNDQAMLDTYLNDYDIRFGRDLGGVFTAVKYGGGSIREDSANPGHVDISYFASQSKPQDGASDTFKSHFSGHLDVGLHDRQNAYPDFMAKYNTSEAADEQYPSNYQAAAELVSAVLQYRYTDFTRPTSYELVNEPHWSYWNDQRFADWHVAVWDRVHSDGLDVAVGGPCMAVSYFYKKRYTSLSSITNFIDNTNAKLDFYSFHSYDYMHWSDQAHDFVGRVSSGLPMEGILDAVNSYTVNHYNKEVPIVLTEHGGYLSGDPQNIITDQLATQLIGAGSGFDWEMKKRSVGNFIMVSSAVGNTMAFLNSPHIIKKAVPFILLETTGWDPRYYASLLIADQFTNKKIWHESANVFFYRLFGGVKGARVEVHSVNPDIQAHAFVDGARTVHLVLNNLSNADQPVVFGLTNIGVSQISVKRVGRNADFTPYFKEENLTGLDGFVLAAREAVALKMTFDNDLVTERTVNETPYYGDKTGIEINGTQTFGVDIDNPGDGAYASLRIGVGRNVGSDRDLSVSLNGHSLQVPMEQQADYLENDSEYGSTKIIPIDPALLTSHNTVKLSFPDGQPGGIGAVVIRVAHQL